MVRLTSSLWPRLLAAILIGFLTLPILPAAAQEDKAPVTFSGPYRREQVAFANGIVATFKHLQQEIQAGRLKLDGIIRLSKNDQDRLRELVVKMTAEYKETLMKLNPTPTPKTP